MKYYEILPTHTETPHNTTRKIANLYIEFNYHFLTLQKKSHYFWTGVYKDQPSFIRIKQFSTTQTKFVGYVVQLIAIENSQKIADIFQVYGVATYCEVIRETVTSYIFYVW